MGCGALDRVNRGSDSGKNKKGIVVVRESPRPQRQTTGLGSVDCSVSGWHVDVWEERT